MSEAIKKFLLIVGLGLAVQVHASSPVAMVLAVSGEVTLDATGKPVRLEALSRLLDGDRIKLGGDARLTLIYPRSGRQENWAGSGALSAGNGESTLTAGTPTLEAKQLPNKIALQLARTPANDASGKAGMVRMRAIAGPDDLEFLESNYAKLRAEAPANDRTPEIYWLAGLNELGMTARLREELAKLNKAYPDDPTLRALNKVYAAALKGPAH